LFFFFFCNFLSSDTQTKQKFNLNSISRSIVTPINRYAPQSGRLNIPNKLQSQLLATITASNEIGAPFATSAHATAITGSTIHLPPLQTINPTKFPERQRRTQLLQKQRLRKEYFH
jgi:hypothetical protein